MHLGVCVAARVGSWSHVADWLTAGHAHYAKEDKQDRFYVLHFILNLNSLSWYDS